MLYRKIKKEKKKKWSTCVHASSLRYVVQCEKKTNALLVFYFIFFWLQKKDLLKVRQKILLKLIEARMKQKKEKKKKKRFFCAESEHKIERYIISVDIYTMKTMQSWYLQSIIIFIFYIPVYDQFHYWDNFIRHIHKKKKFKT